MPRFFIDLHNGVNYVKDTKGFDLPDIDAAREKLVRIMAQVGQVFDSKLDRQDCLAVVLDDTRRVVLRAHLTLDIEPADAP